MSKPLEDLKSSICDIVSSQEKSIAYDKVFRASETKSIEIFDFAIEELLKSGKIIATKKKKLLTPKMAGLLRARITSVYSNCVIAAPFDSDNLPDIYISVSHVKGARINDIVLLSHLLQTKKGFRAHVEKIAYRSNRLLKGTVKEIKDRLVFVPDSSRSSYIPIGSGESIRMSIGDKVQACILKIRKCLVAKVIKVYGSYRSAKVCATAVMESYDIKSNFPNEVLTQARKFEKYTITKADIKSRLDLRKELIFTIDGENAKDLDDAIHVKKLDSGFELGVHIADVSHFVKYRSKVDVEAFKRGTSVYFADRVIPMLPKQLSNGLCSLSAGNEKLTFSVIMKIDNDGNLLEYDLHKTIIKSKAHGIYSEVNSILEGAWNERLKSKYNKVLDSIFVAKELADILSQASKRRGHISFNEKESVYVIDDNGVCIGIGPRNRLHSEHIIEEFMIMANQAVAKYARKMEIPFIYRNHKDPNPEKVYVLMDVIKTLGIDYDFNGNVMTATDINSLIDKVKGTKHEEIVLDKLMYVMSKAVYSSYPKGHFGLVLDDYCHFTSPIRRYPDLAVHRILSQLFMKKRTSHDFDQFYNLVDKIAVQSTNTEIKAACAEREAEKCYMAEYARNYIGKFFTGKICRVSKHGMFVDLKNGIQGFVRISSFVGLKLVYDGNTCYKDMASNKVFKIGDQIKVKLSKASTSVGVVDLEPIVS